MQFFIGIVPPEEYLEKILNLQKQWKHNLLPKVIEPHITVKAQGGLTPEKDWQGAIRKICKDTSPFKIKLNKPSFFGKSVVYLSVESKEIYKLHRGIVYAVSPEEPLIKKYMELDDYIPHLTLGQTYWGLSSEELKEMAKSAETLLSPYPTIDVNFLRIYQEVEPNKYKKYLDIQLKK